MTGDGRRPVTVRPATLADGALLLAWRNDPEVRAWSRTSDPIDPRTHEKWLQQSLTSTERHLLVVEGSPEGVPVATTHYDVLPPDPGRAARSRWEVSIAVAPGLRRHGLGSSALRACDAWLFATEPEATDVVAWIRTANDASRRLFERHGYEPVDPGRDGMACYVRRRPGP